jgi:hypothetical protein
VLVIVRTQRDTQEYPAGAATCTAQAFFHKPNWIRDVLQDVEANDAVKDRRFGPNDGAELIRPTLKGLASLGATLQNRIRFKIHPNHIRQAIHPRGLKEGTTPAPNL